MVFLSWARKITGMHSSSHSQTVERNGMERPDTTESDASMPSNKPPNSTNARHCGARTRKRKQSRYASAPPISAGHMSFTAENQPR
ncbi:hypothetical protein D3C81_1531570 [compost metagenome]